jgi:hypothetical protein
MVNAKVRVVVRVRPLLDHEEAAQHTTSLLSVDKDRGGIVVVDEGRGSTKQKKHEFRFDAVFDGSTPQRELFEGAQVADMAKAVARGYNATIFGQSFVCRVVHPSLTTYFRTLSLSIAGQPTARQGLEKLIPWRATNTSNRNQQARGSSVHPDRTLEQQIPTTSVSHRE